MFENKNKKKIPVTQDVVNTFGALGEMMAILSKSMQENGFTRQEAVTLCGYYVAGIAMRPPNTAAIRLEDM